MKQMKGGQIQGGKGSREITTDAAAGNQNAQNVNSLHFSTGLT